MSGSLIQQSDQLDGKLTNLTNKLCIIFWQLLWFISFQTVFLLDKFNGFCKNLLLTKTALMAYLNLANRA